MMSTIYPSDGQYELHIEYRQNGRLISDTLFRAVPFYWQKQDELAAREAAFALVREQGCGTAAVYICPARDHSIKTYISTDMCVGSGAQRHA